MKTRYVWDGTVEREYTMGIGRELRRLGNIRKACVINVDLPFFTCNSLHIIVFIHYLQY